MLTYEVIEEYEDYAIIEYYIENNKNAKGKIKFNKTTDNRFESVELLEKSKEDFFGGWSKFMLNYYTDFKKNNKLSKKGIIAWY